MANKKIKKVPLDKGCLLEALRLRNISIRKLGSDYDFGWTSKSVERGIKDGRVSVELMEALGKFLDVDTDYLSGKYHRACEKTNIHLLAETLKKQLKAEKFPYLLKQQLSRYDNEFLYSKYLEYILTIHEISMRQFDSLTQEKKKDFQLDLEDAIASVLIKHFPHNVKGEDTWPEVYRVKIEIENYNANEPQELKSLSANDVDNSDIFEEKYRNLQTIGVRGNENKK